MTPSAPPVRKPAVRRLRVYAFDPNASLDLTSAKFSSATIALTWEDTTEEGVSPGPVNEYLEVIDIDPASQQVYDPIDLNAPEVLAQDGLSPSEGDPRFHQQGSAEDLALKVDHDVNNTSLALALETPDGRVLLFPADAQVGSWLSWHDQRYPKDPKDPTKGRTAAELLGAVVLYKVGHHGSHNATAQAAGLELMTSSDLVAMIPVVRLVAQEQASKTNPAGWAMPYDRLNIRLNEKARGRIVCGDGDPKFEAAAFDGDRSIFSLRYDNQNADPLWAELRLPI
jgi:hypothetical protein